MANYRLTRETKRIGNKALYRIQATAHNETHGISPGDLGGWVESEANLSQDGVCWIADEAIVMEQAYVSENALVSEEALVEGMAKVKGDARVFGDAIVGGEVNVGGSAMVYDDADLNGTLMLWGNAHLYGQLALDSCMKVYGEARISDHDDYINITGPFFLTVYKTKDGHSKVPDVLPESLKNFVVENALRWSPTAVDFT